MTYCPNVTVIIPAFNSAATLPQCLESVRALNYPQERVRVVVVDHCSTDATNAIASSYADEVSIKIGGTISSVRNLGAETAGGEIYAFTDSDCIVDPYWLSVAVEVLSDESVGGCGSGYLTPEKFTWVEKAWLYELKGPPVRTSFLPGGNLIIRGSVFREIGGFDESLTTGEDADICSRINKSGRLVINDSRIRCVHLGNAKTLAVFFRKERWYGANMMEGFSVKEFDATFVATMAFSFGVISGAVGLACYFYKGDPLFLLLSLAAVLTVPAGSAILRVMRSRKYAYFPQMVVLYAVYFSARACAMMMSISQGGGKPLRSAGTAR